MMYSIPFLLRVLGLLWLVLSLLGQTQDERLATHLDTTMADTQQIAPIGVHLQKERCK